MIEPALLWAGQVSPGDKPSPGCGWLVISVKLCSGQWGIASSERVCGVAGSPHPRCLPGVPAGSSTPRWRGLLAPDVQNSSSAGLPSITQGQGSMSRSRHVGKIRKRLEDVKSRWVRPARTDFSDNESARLATDALLDGGPEAYWQALSQEGEVDFLSSVEAQYIQSQAKEPPCAPETPGGAEAGAKGLDSCSLQSGTYFPVASEGSAPTLLHTWASAEKPYLKEKSSATVYFQTDKHSNIRDLIRRCIARTSQVAMTGPGSPWPWAGRNGGWRRRRRKRGRVLF